MRGLLAPVLGIAVRLSDCQARRGALIARCASRTRSRIADIVAPVQPEIPRVVAPSCTAVRVLTQLVGLERRTARGGRDSIDHAPGAHDDLANAVAGLAAAAERGTYDSSLSCVG